MNPHNNRIKKILLVWVALTSVPSFAAETSEKASGAKTSVFATIGKETITWQDYTTELSKTAKNKYYHAQPSDAEVAALQRTVADKMVTDALVLNEANRRKLKPDAEAVDQELQRYERRVVQNENWEESKDRVLPVMTKQFQNQNLVKKMEEIVRQVPAPREAQVKAYYTDHPDKFTAPMSQRVSVIVLSVDPSSTSAEWGVAMEDGKALVKRIREGADFAEMAKQYSKDALTVDQGGDMGYLHQGMLPDLPQQTVDKLKEGEVSDPIRLLNGVTIFRLTERKPSSMASYESSKQRASELWIVEQSDDAWSNFIAKLKSKTPMSVDESRFLPLAKAAGSK